MWVVVVVVVVAAADRRCACFAPASAPPDAPRRAVGAVVLGLPAVGVPADRWRPELVGSGVVVAVVVGAVLTVVVVVGAVLTVVVVVGAVVVGAVVVGAVVVGAVPAAGRWLRSRAGGTAGGRPAPNSHASTLPAAGLNVAAPVGL
jgi:hypothetical protein